MEILPTKAYGATGSVFNGLKPVTVERTPLDNQEVAMHRRSVAGAIIGGIAGTRDARGAGILRRAPHPARGREDSDAGHHRRLRQKER